MIGKAIGAEAIGGGGAVPAAAPVATRAMAGAKAKPGRDAAARAEGGAAVSTVKR